MDEPIREEGFVVITSSNGGLDGHTLFYASENDAHDAAEEAVNQSAESFPVYVVPVTRYVTERIRQMRGQSFR